MPIKVDVKVRPRLSARYRSLRCYRTHLTQHIRLTSFAKILATPKFRICWGNYMKSDFGGQEYLKTGLLSYGHERKRWGFKK